ncbi:hypothetical protein F4780DRAFT_730518 [Xylariomycetidae sp. FL0641]|nr:hypothetical protein F4780DRAFT_730518 [Xylariomycetidae sp. FL0641]
MAQEKMTLEDWLDDLCVRFIINLPREDLSSVARICFQIEEAQWFYEDFIRPLDPNLPSMSLRSFSMKMFQHCPLLASFSTESHLKAFEEFMQYKTRVPVRGAVMLNEAMDATVLVRGYKKGASWSFPRGKINKDEDDLDCAVREVREETGFDLKEAGLVDRNMPVHPLEVTMHDQQVRLYVFRGIPEDTVFETKTRKEIGAIKWYNVSDLPAYRKKKGAGKNQGAAATSQQKFYMVAPFMVQLRQWVVKQKKLDARKAQVAHGYNPSPGAFDEIITDDNILHEVVQQPTQGTTTEQPDVYDNATRELHRVLQFKPPTQGLQIPSPTADQQAGHALMSLLQPKTAGNGPTAVQTQGMPHTPLEQQFSQAPEPRSPHHHHHPHQRLLYPNHAPPPSFPVDMSAGSNQGQYRPRPHVYVSNEVHIATASSQPPRNVPNHPVRLLHPQPLPPQVQQAVLLREMDGSPVVAGPTAQPGHGHVGPPQPGQSAAQAPQYGLHGPVPFHHNESKPPPQLSAHSMNLLNALKGSDSQTHPTQPAGPQTVHSHVSTNPSAVNMPYNHQHPAISQHMPSHLPTNHPAATTSYDRQHPAPVSEFAAQYGPSAMPKVVNPAADLGSQATLGAAPSRPPTDKHRAGLLGMFKKVETVVQHEQVDGQTTTTSSSQGSVPSRSTRSAQFKGPEAGQAVSAAETLRAAALENGRPIQMNPETNLPFGAHSILSRPQRSQVSTNSPLGGYSNASELRHNIPMRPHPGSASSGARMSPRQSQNTSGEARIGQPSPQAQRPTAHAYPYGPAQQSTPNPLALFPNPPAASNLPVPNIIKPRQGSTVEQKNALLSLFGKSKSGAEPDPNNEPVVANAYGHAAAAAAAAAAAPAVASRSRLSSLASSGGDGKHGPEGGRRGSGTPLSPADRNFLLGFLENASNNARR